MAIFSSSTVDELESFDDSLESMLEPDEEEEVPEDTDTSLPSGVSDGEVHVREGEEKDDGEDG